MSQLSIVKSGILFERNSPVYISTGSYGVPLLAYSNNNNLPVSLYGNGSPTNRLLTCKELRNILSRNFIKGTKFIASTYNPILYYLFPEKDDPEKEYNELLFNVKNKFVPTLSIPELVRNEVDGFKVEPEPGTTKNSVKSIKACDNWYDNPDLANEITEELDVRVNEIFGCYKDFTQLDIEKEVERKIGKYSIDITTDSYVFSLLSPDDYTDTINLEDWIYASGKCNGNKEVLIDEGKVQIEYVNKILKIYPKSLDVNEVSFTDCVLTVGKL